MHSSIKGMPERRIGAVFLSAALGFSLSGLAYTRVIRHLPFNQNLLVITAVVLAVGSSFLAWIQTRWAAQMVLRRAPPTSPSGS